MRFASHMLYCSIHNDRSAALSTVCPAVHGVELPLRARSCAGHVGRIPHGTNRPARRGHGFFRSACERGQGSCSCDCSGELIPSVGCCVFARTRVCACACVSVFAARKRKCVSCWCVCVCVCGCCTCACGGSEERWREKKEGLTRLLFVVSFWS